MKSLCGNFKPIMLLTVLTICSCGKTSMKDEASEIEFLELGNYPTLLVNHAFSPINVNINSHNNPKLDADTIRRSVLAWLQPLRKYSNRITSVVNVGKYADYQVNIKVQNTSGRAFASPWTGEINLFNNSSYLTVLHELGHLFGLGDTYTGSGGDCMAGQPFSLMCSLGADGLTDDDIAGVSKVFCGSFPGECQSPSGGSTNPNSSRIVFMNNSSLTAFFAYAFSSGGEILTNGWRKVESRKTATYIANSTISNVYCYAKGANNKQWPGNYELCVDPLRKFSRISKVKCQGRSGYELVSFFKAAFDSKTATYTCNIL